VQGCNLHIRGKIRPLPEVVLDSKLMATVQGEEYHTIKYDVPNGSKYPKLWQLLNFVLTRDFRNYTALKFNLDPMTKK